MYKRRAIAIHKLIVKLRERVDVILASGTPLDKMRIIKTSVEVINKLLWTYLIDKNMSENIDNILNKRVININPTIEDINKTLQYIRQTLITCLENKTKELIEDI